MLIYTKIVAKIICFAYFCKEFLYKRAYKSLLWY